MMKLRISRKKLNIIRGIGSILEMSPVRTVVLGDPKTDARKLHSDWHQIGQDFRVALKKSKFPNAPEKNPRNKAV
jgi:hypothetical protein